MLHAFVNITTKESTSTPLIVFQAEPVFSYDLTYLDVANNFLTGARDFVDRLWNKVMFMIFL
jgi:hypothetical protein